MIYKTKLDACYLRYEHQVERLSDYLKLIHKTLLKSKNKKLILFAYESLIVRMVSFLEEYLSCLVGLAAGWEEKSTREYFLECGSPDMQNQVKKGCNLGMLSNFAKTQISFENNAKKLKRIFNHLFGYSPFPDKKTESLILDMVLIRNMIIHGGSLPSESYAAQIRNPGVIIKSDEIESEEGFPPIIFYDHELIENNFLLEAIKAAISVGFHIQGKLQKDLRFSYIK